MMMNALRSVEFEALPAVEGAGPFRDRCSRCHALQAAISAAVAEKVAPL